MTVTPWKYPKNSKTIYLVLARNATKKKSYHEKASPFVSLCVCRAKNNIHNVEEAERETKPWHFLNNTRPPPSNG